MTSPTLPRGKDPAAGRVSRQMQRSVVRGVVAALGLTALTGCTGLEPKAVDAVVGSAYRPTVMPVTTPPAPSYELLAGDLHCHINPPDFAPHVIRDLDSTVELAEREGLDFVVLTPHVWARFSHDETLRERLLTSQAALRRQVAALPPGGRTAFIVGFEYSDGYYGHVGASFGDLEGTLAGLSVAEAREHPEAFFERYVASGGFLVVNHPFTTPVDFPVPIARADLSWRPFTSTGPFPPEIEAVRRLALGYEAFNLTTTELRDRFLLRDRQYSIRTTLARLDQEILATHRPMFPVGGSDSHGHSLRATTFVLSTGRSPAQIREALGAGRVCIRSPSACSLQARVNDGAWVPIGTRLRGSRVEVRAQGSHVEVVRNGKLAGRGDGGAVVSVDTPPDECSVLRASVDEGESAPIYVNCAL